jgi:hypothetical protein
MVVITVRYNKQINRSRQISTKLEACATIILTYSVKIVGFWYHIESDILSVQITALKLFFKLSKLLKWG